MKNVLNNRRDIKRKRHREKVLHEKKNKIVFLQR